MNEKNVINVLIAVPQRDSRVFTEQLKSTLKENQFFQVLHFYTVHTLSQIDTYVEQRKVDVVICAEDLGNDNKIGQGSIKRWSQYDEHVRIVMILFDDKRKGTKVGNFLKNGYYNAIFFSDLYPEMLIDIIVNGRTEEAASKYYFSDAENELLKIEREVQEELSVSAEENIGELLIEESVQYETSEVNDEEKNQVIPEKEDIISKKAEWEESKLKRESVFPVKQKKEEISVSICNDTVPESINRIETCMGSIKATVDTKGMLLSLDNAMEDIGELEGCRVLINIFRE